MCEASCRCGARWAFAGRVVNAMSSQFNSLLQRARYRMRNLYAFRSGNRRLGGSMPCVAEPIESRLLLSAGDPNIAFGVGGLAHVDVGYEHAETVDVDSVGNKTVMVADVWGEKHQMGMVVARLDAAGKPDPT